MPAAAAASRMGRGNGPPPISTASNSASAAVAAGSVSALANCVATSDVYRRPEPNRLTAVGNSAISKPCGDVQLDGRGTGEHAAHQHLHPGDVIRRHGQ